MRVRVVRSLSGVLDRVKLSSFKPGLSYDVDPSLGQYLISQRFAEELTDTDPVLIVPLDETYFDFDHVRGGIEIVRNEPQALGPRSPRRSLKRR
jgi:hypothetical protein